MSAYLKRSAPQAILRALTRNRFAWVYPNGDITYTKEAPDAQMATIKQMQHEILNRLGVTP